MNDYSQQIGELYKMNSKFVQDKPIHVVKEYQMRDQMTEGQMRATMGSKFQNMVKKELSLRRRESSFERTKKVKLALDHKNIALKLKEQPSQLKDMLSAKELANKIPRNIGEILALRKKNRLEKDQVLIEKMRQQHVDIVQMSNHILTGNSWKADNLQDQTRLADIYKQNGKIMEEHDVEKIMGYPVYAAIHQGEEI